MQNAGKINADINALKWQSDETGRLPEKGFVADAPHNTALTTIKIIRLCPPLFSIAYLFPTWYARRNYKRQAGPCATCARVLMRVDECVFERSSVVLYRSLTPS